MPSSSYVWLSHIETDGRGQSLVYVGNTNVTRKGARYFVGAPLNSSHMSNNNEKVGNRNGQGVQRSMGIELLDSHISKLLQQWVLVIE
jgi:hypothetical protein